MGRANQALKQTLEQYGITQYRLAKTLGLERSNIYRWVNDVRDPNSETVVQIVEALKTLNPAAAKTFVKLYLGDLVDEE
jgi:transcriptional regulator with XRE-family HTH domain